MPKEVIYRCDHPGCTRIRGECNHWFWIRNPDNTLTANTYKPLDRYIQIGPFFPSKYQDGDKIFCGEEHMLMYVSKLLKIMQTPAS
jgi:hypothetical protein